MPRILTQAQIDTFHRDGCVFPIRVMSISLYRGTAVKSYNDAAALPERAAP